MALPEPLIETPHYPAVAFLVAYGKLLALLVGLALALGGIAAGVLGLGWWWAVLGVVSGLLAWLLLRAYAEVLTIISETLLPQ